MGRFDKRYNRKPKPRPDGWLSSPRPRRDYNPQPPARRGRAKVPKPPAQPKEFPSGKVRRRKLKATVRTLAGKLKVPAALVMHSNDLYALIDDKPVKYRSYCRGLAKRILRLRAEVAK